MNTEATDLAKQLAPSEQAMKKEPNGIGATETLASFVAKTSLDNVPSKAISRLRDFLLDWIGISAFAATHAESSPAIHSAIRQIDPDEGPATVVGETKGYGWLYAALLNGCHAHSLDFDDTNLIQIGHPGAPVIAAAIADAERIDASGRAFFEALAVGYEVACRVGAALGQDSYNRGFHITATAGIFGAVAAVAKLRSFDSKKIENAFGLALSKAAGSMQYLENGAWNKRLHPGFAAHDALLCASLAEAGVVGAAAAFEGHYGLLTGYTGDPHPEALTDKLGENWLLFETALKPYPSCRMTHGAIDAALKLRDSVPVQDREQVSICVELPLTSMNVVGENVPSKIAPQNTVDAQFSVYFQVAAAWLDGDVNWGSYDQITAPEMVEMMKRISTKENSTVPIGGAVVNVETSGKKFSDTVNVPLGEPENWIGSDALRHKFMLLAVPTYGEEHAARIADLVLHLDPGSSVREIIQLLRVHERK